MLTQNDILKILEHDDLMTLKKSLESKTIDPNRSMAIGLEYDLEEHDELPLLLFAIQHGVSRDMIELLVTQGADIHYRDSVGVGALDVAIKHRRFDIVSLCGEYDISFTQSQRKSGLTPLMLAASFNDTEMVNFLLEQGADATEHDRYGMSALDYAKRMGHNTMVELLQDYFGKNGQSNPQ